MSVGTVLLLIFLILVYLALGAFLVVQHIEEHECPVASVKDDIFVLKSSDYTIQYHDISVALQEWEKVYPHCPLPTDWIDYYETNKCEKSDTADLVEFEEPPDDDPVVENFAIDVNYDYYPYHTPNEEFRIIRTTPTNDQIISTRGSGVISTRGRGGYHKTTETTRRFPKQFRRRPWKTYWWRSYPTYVQTYPLTFYDDSWEVPVERFSIRIGPRSFENPDVESKYLVSKGNMIGCGISDAVIDLIYGHSYEFDIFTSIDCITGKRRMEPFIFTMDSDGGKDADEYSVFNVKPTINGVIKFTVTNDTPQKFYYQSINGNDVGGVVYVHY